MATTTNKINKQGLYIATGFQWEISDLSHYDHNGKLQKGEKAYIDYIFHCPILDKTFILEKRGSKISFTLENEKLPMNGNLSKAKVEAISKINMLLMVHYGKQPNAPKYEVVSVKSAEITPVVPETAIEETIETVVSEITETTSETIENISDIFSIDTIDQQLYADTEIRLDDIVGEDIIDQQLYADTKVNISASIETRKIVDDTYTKGIKQSSLVIDKVKYLDMWLWENHRSSFLLVKIDDESKSIQICKQSWEEQIPIGVISTRSQKIIFGPVVKDSPLNKTIDIAKEILTPSILKQFYLFR